MKDVIERMLKVEEEARTLLAEAEKDAAKVAEAARREALTRADALRHEGHEEATKLLEAARAELEKKRAERLGAFDRENAAYAGQVRPKVEEAVAGVVRRVLGSTGSGKGG